MTAPTEEAVTSAGTAGNGVTVPVPTGVAAGKLLVCLISNGGGSSTPTADQTGWTSGRTTGDGVALYYRLAGASEPTSYSFFRASPSGAMVGTMVLVSGVDQTTPVADAGTNGSLSVSTTPLVTPSLAATQTDTLLLELLNYHVNVTVTPPPGSTLLFSTSSTDTVRWAKGAGETVNAGATGTRTWSFGAATQPFGGILAINPSSGSSADATVAAVKATATALATPPVVAGTSNATVAATRATASATAYAPLVSTGVNGVVEAVTATATAEATAPVVSAVRNAAATAAKAAATAAAMAPTVTGTQTATIAALVALATAEAFAPNVDDGSGTVHVVAPKATATAQAYAPVFVGVAQDVVAAPPCAQALAWVEPPTFDYDPPIAPVPPTITRGKKVDKAFAYPTPTMVNGRPT